MADILQIIENLTGYLPSFMSLTGVIFFILGVFLAINAIRGLARRSEMGPGMGSYAPHYIKLIVAIMFVSYPTFEQVLSRSFFGTGIVEDPNQIFALAPSVTQPFSGADGSVARQVLVALTSVIMFVGVIAVGRGLYLLNVAASGTSQVRTMGPGLTFLIAGIMAANFPQFLALINSFVTPAG